MNDPTNKLLAESPKVQAWYRMKKWLDDVTEIPFSTPKETKQDIKKLYGIDWAEDNS